MTRHAHHLLTLLILLTPSAAQQIGTIPELHPQLPTQLCTTSGGCTTRRTSLVTDALSRPFHAAGNPSVSCNTSPINATLCPDAATCAKNCVLEGIDYGSIGVSARGAALTLRQYLFDGAAYTSVSPRVYLLAEDGENYEGLKLLGQELTFDVDLSRLGCGMNGALYLSEMELSGNRGDLNPAGAAYGTGYCDAQCFRVGWINGMPNLNNSGACCNEMDIWEASSVASVYTPHVCSRPSSFLCTGDECDRTASGSGVCDKNGCGLNTYNLGAKQFYGRGLSVDTSKPFTVVTQFLTSDNTTTGTLTEIRRLYVQGGRVIPSTSETTNTGVMGIPGGYKGTITQDYCTARNTSDFNRLGGMSGMGASLARGMVLIFSIWNSPGDFMSWLDSGNNGPCNATEGDPKRIVELTPDVSVTFSNIRWGDIGSTFNAASTAGVEGEAGPTLEGAATRSKVITAAESGAGPARGLGVGVATTTAVGFVALLGMLLS